MSGCPGRSCCLIWRLQEHNFFHQSQQNHMCRCNAFGLCLTCLAMPVVQSTTKARGMSTQNTSHCFRSGLRLQRPCQSPLSSMYAGKWTSCAFLQVHEHACELNMKGQLEALSNSRMESNCPTGQPGSACRSIAGSSESASS